VALSFLLVATVSMASPLPILRNQLALAEEDKDADAVIELARRIVAADPHDSTAWFALVQAQTKNQDYDRALVSLKAWQKVAKSRSPGIDDLRGDIYLAQDLKPDAERAWRSSLAVKADNYLVLSKLADLLETRERWPEVLALRTRAAAAKPAAALLAAKAGALLHLHQWDAATATIGKANKLDASDETVQQWLPKLELLATALPGIKAMDGQIAAKPKDPTPLLDQAAIFSGIGQPGLALSNARRALALSPDSVRARVQAGEAQLDLGHPGDAAKYKVSHDLKRGDNGHLTPQTLRELDQRDADVGKNPRSPKAFAARSKTLRNLNQYVLALDDARAALRLDANSPDAEFEMGHDLDALGRPGEALPHIVHATELRPDDAVAWYYRGVIEANRADYNAAVSSLTRSLGIRESVVALRARMEAELRLSLAPEAAADRERLHQLDPTATE
jgi:tetratricopeptide (TPR) repeat protein